jgi:excisionase family DNA binding protein
MRTTEKNGKIMKNTHYITIGEAAHQLGVHIDTMRAWDRQGVFTSYRVNGKGWRRYDIEEIVEIKLRAKGKKA